MGLRPLARLKETRRMEFPLNGIRSARISEGGDGDVHSGHKEAKIPSGIQGRSWVSRWTCDSGHRHGVREGELRLEIE